MSATPTALVIGGLGFIGVNLTDRLLSGGHAVTVVTRLRARHAARAAAFEARGARIVEGDLRDRVAMARVVRDGDWVFNLAGESGAERSMRDPWTDLDVNCGGNLALLEAIRTERPGAKLVFVGSRLEYGKQDVLPVDEDRPVNPRSLHAIHKLAVEHYLRLYRTLYGLRYTVARVTNPYGPGQPEGRTAYGVVNYLIERALAGASLPLFGDGKQQRDYVFVDDVAAALVALAASPASEGRAFNVGSGVGTRMVDMAGLIIDIAGGGRIEHVPWPEMAERIETGDFVADITRIREAMGWSPAVGLRAGLERTVAARRTPAAS